MPRTEAFSERIGAVFLPEADIIEPNRDLPSGGEGLPLDPGTQGLEGGAAMLPEPKLPWMREPFLPRPFFKICSSTLKQGCYALSFVPSGSIFGTRYRGTLRVEQVAAGLRVSGDLYRYRLLNDLVIKEPLTVKLASERFIRPELTTDEAADTGGTIPIYSRRSYHSYLKGTGVKLFSVVPWGSECTFSLEFDEFVYVHPATGFTGSFNNTPTRSLRCVFRGAGTPDAYTGDALVGTEKVGTISIRWVSEYYRRAHLQINTLKGAVAPPAVGSTTFATIFADAGWDLTVAEGEQITAPAGVNANACWSATDLHQLMSTVPGYRPADLDSVWRVHLIAVPGKLGCSRGQMFDSSIGADPNHVPREGSVTYSDDGYPAGDAPDGSGGSHYDGAANQQQRNVPRAYLRSATHEVGHAFNQIHQQFEGGIDNSIMSPTPSVATVIGSGGTFPDDIILAFNDRVKRHLRHLPDPAVRPGAMDFFGAAVSAPEAADVAWLDIADLGLELSSDQVSLGEPLTLDFELRNSGEVPLAAPAKLDRESLTVRVSVTDPAGRITFMRPSKVSSCPHIEIEELAPDSSVSGSTTLYWGKDGFAFETPGRHLVEVIVLWQVAGVPVGASAERDVFVRYPVSDEDNKVAALMLDPEVGAAVATGIQTEGAAERIEQVRQVAEDHGAAAALDRLGLPGKPQPKRKSRKQSRKKARS